MAGGSGSFLEDAYTGLSSVLHWLLLVSKRVQQCNAINGLRNIYSGKAA